MDKGTIRDLEYIQKYYLQQFLDDDYSVKECSASSCYEEIFDRLFLCNTCDSSNNFNYIEEVDKSIVCQWLDEKNDTRFKNYIKVYLKPYKTISLENFTYKEIFSLISPHNVENS